MSGASVYVNNERSFLFGAPPEIIKVLIQSDIIFPDTIIIPDTQYKFGTVQNSTEFPLYYFLFVLGNYEQGKRLKIIGNKKDVEANLELLRLTLLGPTKDEYKSIGESIYFDELYNEARYLSLKKKDGSEYAIDELVEIHCFTGGRVELDGYTITHDDLNVYSINSEKIDINFDSPQVPRYDLRKNFVPHMPFRFGVDVLGGGSGFTPHHPCSGLVLHHNSELMLVDCVPYLEYSLSARGISMQHVKSIFLSHIHDDHCNMFPLVNMNDRMKFLGTKEIYWMALKKLALQTGNAVSDFSSFFDFVELVPYERNEFYGLTITPHYSVHSIPTIGAVFSMKSGDYQKSLCFVGDNKSVDDIDIMVNSQILTKKKGEYLKDLYLKKFNLLFPDGGMGILHGNPNDSLHSQSDSVVFMHLEKLPPEYDATFSKALAGKRYNILENLQHTYHSFTIQAMQMIQKAFPGISDGWSNAMMNEMQIVRHNIDDIILKQGNSRNGLIYIVLSGRCRVKYHDGKMLHDIAVKEVGDFVGEMAIVNDMEIRTASIVAETPVILCQLSEKIFYQFLIEEKRLESVKKMWELRSELERFSPFSEFADTLNEQVAQASKVLHVETGDVVVREKESTTNFYIVMRGEFDVTIDDKVVNTLTKGGVFGEFGSITGRPRTATVRASGPGHLLEIPASKIENIILQTPALNFYLHQLIKERDEKLNEIEFFADNKDK